MRPLRSVLFFPISAPAPWNAEPIPLGSDSDFARSAFFQAVRRNLKRYPQNTLSIPACPIGPADRTGAVKIFVFLKLEQNERFAKASSIF